MRCESVSLYLSERLAVRLPFARCEIIKLGEGEDETLKEHKVFTATRRQFIVSAAACASLWKTAFAQSGDTAEVRRQALASDPQRPQFHLLPARNWMNDPNGPVFFNGKYHMFFQYNPMGAVWGNMSWNHAVSTDMLHWTHLPVALTPTPGSPDAYGVFSGTAITVGKRVYMVYTATRNSTPELATLKDGGKPIQESQCIAWSDDPNLVHWTKDPNPVIPLPPKGLDITGFRDPSPWKQDGVYYMAVGSGVARKGGCVLLYRSHDLKQWEYLHPLAEGTWNGQHTANPCDDGEMWECPDFFALDGSHVLIYSTLGKVIWQSGSFDTTTLRFTAKKTGVLDFDAFYAPKTQLDAQGRRILWGWVPERRPDAAMLKAGWSGMMSLPRTMRLDPDGTLRLQILPQSSALRGATINVAKGESGRQFTLPESNGEFVAEGRKGADMRVSISSGGNEFMKIEYLPQRNVMVANGHEIQLQPGDSPFVHAFADASVLEVILSERVGYTLRFYSTGAAAADLQVRLTGAITGIHAWKVTPISNDRLTTPSQT